MSARGIPGVVVGDFCVAVSGVGAGDWICATATLGASTSEFSPSRRVQ